MYHFFKTKSLGEHLCIFYNFVWSPPPKKKIWFGWGSPLSFLLCISCPPCAPGAGRIILACRVPLESELAKYFLSGMYPWSWRHNSCPLCTPWAGGIFLNHRVPLELAEYFLLAVYPWSWRNNSSPPCTRGEVAGQIFLARRVSLELAKNNSCPLCTPRAWRKSLAAI